MTNVPSARRFGVFIGLVLLVAMNGCGADIEEAPPELAPDPDWSGVTAWLAASEEVTGGVALRVARGDEVLFEEEHGFSTDAVVPLASATKWMSIATIMSVIDEGLLALDTPIEEFFPEHTGTAQGVVTLAELMSYHGGLGRADCGEMDLDECARAVLAEPVAAPPGTVFEYSDSGWQVAGRMAELATGARFVDLFEERITGPLGMPNTVYLNETNPSLSGGAQSSLEEYDRFLRMIEARGVHRPGREGVPQRVLSEAAVREMESNWTRRLGATIEGWPAHGYGLGVWITGESAPGGVQMVTSGGFFGTYPVVDRQNQIRWIMFMFGDYSDSVPVRNRLRDELIPAALEIPAPRLPAAAGS